MPSLKLALLQRFFICFKLLEFSFNDLLRTYCGSISIFLKLSSSDATTLLLKIIASKLKTLLSTSKIMLPFSNFYSSTLCRLLLTILGKSICIYIFLGCMHQRMTFRLKISFYNVTWILPDTWNMSCYYLFGTPYSLAQISWHMFWRKMIELVLLLLLEYLHLLTHRVVIYSNLIVYFIVRNYSSSYLITPATSKFRRSSVVRLNTDLFSAKCLCSYESACFGNGL